VPIIGLSCESTKHRGKEALVLFVALLTTTFVGDVTFDATFERK
jgi:hypothetical protein